MSYFAGCLVLLLGGWWFAEIFSTLVGDEERVFNQAAIAMLLGVTFVAFSYIGELGPLGWFFLTISFPTTVGFVGHKLYFQFVTS
jgi:hypothetical protein